VEQKKKNRKRARSQRGMAKLREMQYEAAKASNQRKQKKAWLA